MTSTARLRSLGFVCLLLVTSAVSAGIPYWQCWGPGLPDPCRNTLNAVSFVPGTEGVEAWAAGDAGTIVRGDGISWEKTDSGTKVNLHGIAMPRSDLGWAVGEQGKLFVWNGYQWREHSRLVPADKVIRTIATVPDTDPPLAWAAYDYFGVGNFLKFDGSSWEVASQGFAGSVFDIHMLAVDNGWAVGRSVWNGTILHWDGANWETTEFVDDDLYGVGFSSSDDGWAVGEGGAVYHWDGAEWTRLEPITDQVLRSVAALAVDDAWAVGDWGSLFHWNGSQWNEIWSPIGNMDFSSVELLSPTLGWAVGNAGMLVRFDGQRWTPVHEQPLERVDSISRVPGSDDLWAAGAGPYLLHWDGKQWAPVPMSSSFAHSVVMAGPDDGWASGSGRRFHHWDGARWSEVHNPKTASDMVMIDADSGWAVGWGSIQHWDGSSWAEVTSPTTSTFRGVSAAADDDIWAVGYSGTMAHYDGAMWATVASPVDGSLEDVSMASRNEGYAVGWHFGIGVAVEWIGTRWREMYFGSTIESLNGVDVLDTGGQVVGWMVGDNGYTLRLSGGQWEHEPTPTANELNDVVVISANEAWAVGDNGVLLHWSDETPADQPQGALVAATAKLSGQAGTDWMSDLVITNLATETVSVSIEAWLRGQANLNPLRQTISLAPLACSTSEDVLAELFGLPNSTAAALVVDAPGPLAIGSRTYNVTTAGTYGQSIPAELIRDVFAPGQVAVLSGLVEGPDYRSNLGIVNTSTAMISVQVDFFDADGGSLGTMTYDVPAQGAIQRTRVLRDVVSGPVDLAWAELRSPNGYFAAYLSTVDANTGDPVYRPAVSAPPDVAETVLQGLAKVSGAAGTNWSSSLVLVNTTKWQTSVSLEGLIRGQSNPTPERTLVALQPGETKRIDDVLEELYGLSSGALSIKSYGMAGVLLSARTFNLTDEGTYGQFIPAQPLSAAITTTTRGVLVGVAQNDRFRSNLGLTNANSIEATVALTLFDREGVQVESVQQLDLGPGEVMQIDRVSELFGAPVIAGATLIVELEEGASVAAFLSIIDRRTGDPVFQMPTLD